MQFYHIFRIVEVCLEGYICKSVKGVDAGCQILKRLPSVVYLLFGHDCVYILHCIYHSTLRSRIYKRFTQTEPVDKVYWLCLNLLYIVDCFKSTTRVDCQKKSYFAGVTILTSFGSLPAGGK